MSEKFQLVLDVAQKAQVRPQHPVSGGSGWHWLTCTHTRDSPAAWQGPLVWLDPLGWGAHRPPSLH